MSTGMEPMLAFEVPDMSCGHCVGHIQNAVRAADPEATVRVDLSTRRVEVLSAALGVRALESLIREAGYTPRLLN